MHLGNVYWHLDLKEDAGAYDYLSTHHYDDKHREPIIKALMELSSRDPTETEFYFSSGKEDHANEI